MDLSVIICTYNRSSILKKTLQSFFKMEWDPATSYELLVVDNNSTDDTKQAIQSFFNDYRNIIKYVYEGKIGLSLARNTGIIQSQGKIIAFADDDVDFDKRWGQEILNAFNNYPEASCLGGKSNPLFAEGEPDWANKEIYVFYGDTAFGEIAKNIEFPKYPFGLNMAFRKEVFTRVGMFSPKLGRYGNSLLSGEEAELFYRISKNNLKTLYSPSVMVRHRIPAERTKTAWILSRYYWQGVSDIIVDQLIEKRSRKMLFKIAFDDLIILKSHLIGLYAFSPRKLYWHLKSIRPEGWADAKNKIGRIRQALSMAISIRKNKSF